MEIQQQQRQQMGEHQYQRQQQQQQRPEQQSQSSQGHSSQLKIVRKLDKVIDPLFDCLMANCTAKESILFPNPPFKTSDEKPKVEDHIFIHERYYYIDPNGQKRRYLCEGNGRKCLRNNPLKTEKEKAERVANNPRLQWKDGRWHTVSNRKPKHWKSGQFYCYFNIIVII